MSGPVVTALVIGGAWLAGGAVAAVALARAIGLRGDRTPKPPPVVPDGYATGRADLQLTHRRDEEDRP